MSERNGQEQRTYADEDPLAETAKRIIESTPLPPMREENTSFIGRAISDAGGAVVAYMVRAVGIFWEWFGGGIRSWFDANDAESRVDLKRELDAHVAGDRMTPAMRAEFLRAEEALPWPIDGFFIGGMRIYLKIIGAWQWAVALGRMQQQTADSMLRPALLDQNALIRYLMRDPNRFGEVKDIFDRWGLPDNQLTMLLAGSENEPGISELIPLVNRELLTESEARQRLQNSGYDSEMQNKLMALADWLPPASDLASLAGREAFEEDQITKFGLDADLPERYLEEAAKVGVSAKVARWYWVAHWSNPSIQQFFEMVHRRARNGQGGIWTGDDVAEFARLADINPTFVEGLTDIAYRPLTRVDVRRMYEDGVLDYDAVKRSYLDLGYDETNAVLMADWTKAYAERGTRQLTRTQIVSMYELRQITRVQLADQLEVIGFDPDEASVISHLAAAQREEARLKSFVRKIEYEFKRGFTDKAAASRDLYDAGIEPEQVQELIHEWENETVYERALPSKQDLVGWFEGGQIEADNFRDRMRALRFDDADIDLYMLGDVQRLSKTDVLRLFDQGGIDEARARVALLDLGYTETDTDALMQPVIARIKRRADLEQAARDTRGSAEDKSTSDS